MYCFHFQSLYFYFYLHFATFTFASYRCCHSVFGLLPYSVVALFSLRNFAVGITFKKTEVLLSVFIGFVILGDTVSFWALCAVLVGLGGVLLLADPPQMNGPWHGRIINKAVLLGLTSGVFFGLSGVNYRGASLSIAEGDTFYRAIVAMAFVVVFQFVSMPPNHL